MIFLDPFTSVNEYLFHKTFKDINRQFGKATKVIQDNVMEELYETRDGFEFTYIGNHLADVSTTNNSSIHVLNVKREFDLASEISDLKDFSPYLVSKKMHYILFPDLGICAGGYLGKKIPEGKILIFFSKERLEFYKTFIDV